MLFDERGAKSIKGDLVMANISRYSPLEAQKLITEQGYVYVDVRSEGEYAAGHPTASLNVPVMLAGPGGMQPNPDFMRVMNALFPKDAKLVVGCKAGGRSMRAAEMLVAAGFSGVVDQRAGFDGPRDPAGKPIEPGWAASSLPVENVTPGGSYAELKTKAEG
jgi:rhodanese-related sulfurtransferase